MRRREFIAGLGGAAAWPMVARAQRDIVSAVGVLNGQSPKTYRQLATQITDGLSEAGFVEGKNVSIEYRWAEGIYDRLPSLAADLVNRQVAVIVAGGAPGSRAVVAAQAATRTIPIVFTSGDDPVASGLVPQLNRPGGNTTGVTFFAAELGQKRLELLLQLVPSAVTVALLVNPENSHYQSYISDMQTAARAFGRHLVVAAVSTEAQFKSAFDDMTRQSADALVISAEAFLYTQRNQIAALAERAKIPSIAEAREFVVAGGLMSYGPSLADAYRQAGAYAGKVLQGADPGDLPILRATKFELVINLKTAKTLAVEIPPTLLARADEVVE